MTTLGERIRIARGSQSQEVFAKALGISKGSLGFYERNANQPNASILADICEKYKILPEWLIMGTGPIRRGEVEASHPFIPEETPPEEALEEIIVSDEAITLLPMVEARLSAGHGSLSVSASVERRYAFRSDFLARKGHAKDMVLMRVSGDSMAPEIKDGDVVLIDQGKRELHPGKIYAVGVEDMVYLKQVDAKPGEIILSSINDRYEPLRIDATEQMSDRIRIIGRAIWWCREN